MQAAESKADFIHKMKIALKELRETNNCLKIIQQMNWIASMEIHLNECNELIAIFVSSIATASKRLTSRPANMPGKKPQPKSFPPLPNNE